MKVDLGRLTPEEVEALVEEALSALSNDVAVQAIVRWAKSNEMVDELAAWLEPETK